MSEEKRIFREWLNGSSGFFYTINRTLHKGRSTFQELELVDTDEFGNVLLLDGITQVAQKSDWQYHEPMVHFPLLSHRQPEQVLVIGGG
ncbi:spermine/spermidine synthase domain-containing protein, partial [Salinispira pacifica]